MNFKPLWMPWTTWWVKLESKDLQMMTTAPILVFAQDSGIAMFIWCTLYMVGCWCWYLLLDFSRFWVLHYIVLLLLVVLNSTAIYLLLDPLPTMVAQSHVLFAQSCILHCSLTHQYTCIQVHKTECHLHFLIWMSWIFMQFSCRPT